MERSFINASPAVDESEKEKNVCFRPPPGPCPCQNEGHQKCKVRGGRFSRILLMHNSTAL